jgi:UDP-N-acetylglucosamine 2-epimerase (non-hydrolysing)
VKRILVVFGTRPEAIKMAPLILELKSHPSDFEIIVVVTGQHREMLDQVLNLFEIVPDYDLNIMSAGQDLYDITNRVLTGMRDIIKELKPNLVLVHGDTTTSMATALAAFYQQIPVGHVEAGLRTNNLLSPWPEELNRQVTGRIASLHFTPTETGKENLLKENVPDERIIVTGNTVIDAIMLVIERIRKEESVKALINNTLISCGYNPENVSNKSRRLVLITGHRRENFGEGFVNICNAIVKLAGKFPDVDFVYPVHRNPNVRKPVLSLIDPVANPNIFLIQPLDYLPFVYLMSISEILLTDSGGIQEEAPGLGKPVLVMRNTTERPEAVEAGTVELVGTDTDKIINSVSELLTNNNRYSSMANAINPYGDGLASKRIAEFLKKHSF